VAYVSGVGAIKASRAFEESPELSRELVDSSLVRCPDKEASNLMVSEIEKARDDHDSIGGIVTCICRNVPVGLGEPCFDKVLCFLN
jgi:chorismate synthase